MIDRILRAKAAADRLGISIRTFYREVSIGNIPPGMRITERISGWRESTIEKVIADRERGKMSSTTVASEKRKPGRPRKLPVTGILQ